MGRSCTRTACLLAILALTAQAPALAATTNNWTGASGTNWHDNGNWSQGHYPAAGEAVVIGAAGSDPVLAADSAALASFVITNKTLTFKNWTTTLNATTVTIRNAGVLALPEAFLDSEMSNRVHIACTNLSIEEGGTIDADGGGFEAWDGPGAGSGTLAYKAAGGSYGGRGGYGTRSGSYSSGTPAAPTYGNPAAPVEPGSGGGSYKSSGYRLLAGDGGGAVWIDASGTVRVDGTITADGGDGTHYLAAGGSGGSIYISCVTFGGADTGLIRARGGNAVNNTDSSGGGGGGRIALDYVSLAATHDVHLSTSPARIDWALVDLEHRYYQTPRIGTLWLPDMQLLSSVIDGDQFEDVRILGPASWSVGSLTVTDSSLTFGEDGFALTVTGDILIGTNGLLGIGPEYEPDGTYAALACGGSLTLTNGGALWVHAGRTNGTARDHGALVAVTNDLVIGPQSWVYPVSRETDGASPRFVMANLSVATGGGISANARGHAPGTGPGKGAGSYSTLYQDGAGHGGLGGIVGSEAVDVIDGGGTYGSISMPALPGSGGTQHINHGPGGGTGGGVIRLEASGTVTVGGTLAANGGDGLSPHGAGASGGSILITCDTFGGSASGLLSATGGGIMSDQVNKAAGGGGRIAVHYQSLAGEHDAHFTAAAGVREWATLTDENANFRFRAQEGTLWLPDTGLLSETLDGRFNEIRIFGPTSWNISSLTISNSTVTLSQPGLVVTVTNDLVVGSNGVFGIGDQWSGSGIVLRCGGSLVLTNGGACHTYAGTGVDHGLLVAVTNDLRVGTGSSLYPVSHRSDGGAPLFRVGDLHVATGGLIDARGRGYACYTGAGTSPDKQPTAGGGGGYGGRGGGGFYAPSKLTSQGGAPYGSAHTPSLPGSGGGSYWSSYGRMGGYGGGLVRVEATGEVSVNGTITADGFDAIKVLTGGGAGGGIHIQCDTFGGSSDGLLTAEGGDGYAGASYSGGGGGGRIAVDYNSLSATHDLRFSVAPASASWAYSDTTNLWQILPRVGTLSLPDAGLLSTTLTDDRFAGAVSLWFQDIATWEPASLTVSNCWVAFGQDAFRVQVAGDVLVTSGGALGVGHYHDGSDYRFEVGGSLILTNGGELHVYGGLTNAMGEGDVSAVVAVTNDLIVRAGSSVFPSAHDTDGGSPVLRMRNLVLDAGAAINADAKGYRGRHGPGVGQSATSLYPAGSGHGGRGADSSNGRIGGATYGQTNGPALPGSGGGSYSLYSYYEARTGAGGGPVRIEARGDASVNGTITANGGLGPYDHAYSAGASGGGIYITCATFAGGTAAVMRADGSDSRLDNTGGGGGGRIAVWQGVNDTDRTNYLDGGSVSDLVINELFANYWGKLSVTNGAGGVGSAVGTAYYLRTAAGGTYELTILGDPGLHDTPTPHGYGVNTDIPEDSVLTNSVTAPYDEGGGLRRACLGFDLADYNSVPVSNGVSNHVVFTLSTNLVLTWHWTNEWYLSVSSATPTSGSVNASTVNGWYTNGLSVANITPAPSNGWAFLYWTGDFPAGHATDNPLSVTMDQARTLVANFTPAISEIKTWTGAGSWDTPTNWSPAGLPTTLDHAVIGSGSCSLSNSKYLVSLVVSNGAELVFTNWSTKLFIDAGVTVQSNGTITCAGPFEETQMSNRVQFTCSNLLVEAGGVVGVDGRGFAPWNGPGTGSNTYHGCGAGYGGRGGRSDVNWGTPQFPGLTYGSASAPLTPGSGGGSHASHQASGGAGGGAVVITVSDAATLNGTLSANGNTGLNQYAGGGSGGSILLTCATLGGTGLLRAQGGNGLNTYPGGGGGGRIAVDYAQLAPTHDVHFSTSPAELEYATRDMTNLGQHASAMGTLWLPDTNLLAAVLPADRFLDCNLVIDGVTSLSMDSLTVSSNRFGFAEDGSGLEVTGDLSLLSGAVLTLGSYESQGSNFTLTCGGSLVVSNSGCLMVYAGLSSDAGPDIGATVRVTNDLVVGPSSVFYARSHCTDGASPLIVAGSLHIAQGGRIDAIGGGYYSKLGPGVGTPGLYAPGSGHGGKGGAGGDYMVQPPLMAGDTYGSIEAPNQPGSGGATHSSHYAAGGNGGGRVRIDADGEAVVDGTIIADATPGITVHAGGGSGGGIHVTCDTFGGSGLISAAGGDASAPNGAAGGGGRIAIDYQALAAIHDVSFGAAPGGGDFANSDPTNRWHHVPREGTLWLPDLGLLTGDLTGRRFRDVSLYFPGTTSWVVNALVVSNCSVTFADSGFQLDVANDVRIEQGGKLGLGGAHSGTGYVLNCGGDLSLADGGTLFVYSGATNATGADYGALVDVAGDLSVGAGSWVHPVAHTVNGGAPLFRTGGLTVEANAGFNAAAKGYPWQAGPGAGGTATPGGGGGGHGGRGADGGGGTGGSAYGSSNAPILPGSGGGAHNFTTYKGRAGSGGGVVRIETRSRAAIDGVLTADAGESLHYAYVGGGAGGSVYLTCTALDSSPSARISAEGSSGHWNSPTTGAGGGGGGGRIAIWIGGNAAARQNILSGGSYPGMTVSSDLTAVFDGSSSVTNGPGYLGGTPAEVGTMMVYVLPPPAGTLFIMR